MSRSRCLVALAPAGVALLELPSRKRHVLELPADAGEDWRPAAQALRAFCEAHPVRGARLEVLLSHAFVRFVAAPWSDALASSKSAARYLGGLFEATHGPRDWHCVAEERLAAAPRMAAGIDRELLEALAACGPLASAAPWIVPACGRTKRGDGWFAALEPGWIALAAVRDGRIEELARVAFEGDAGVALARALRRQSLREGLDAAAPLATAGRADSIEPWLELAA